MASAHLPQAASAGLLHKIGALSRAHLAEVETFVDFITQRDQARLGDRALAKSTSASSQDVLNAIWSNPEDDVYDAI